MSNILNATAYLLVDTGNHGFGPRIINCQCTDKAVEEKIPVSTLRTPVSAAVATQTLIQAGFDSDGPGVSQGHSNHMALYRFVRTKVQSER
jgi:hypothetical protein